MNTEVQTFYDQLAGSYEFIFRDWQQAVRRQGEALDHFIQAQGQSKPLALLDCTCGVGTQALGLAARGYNVHATDLSPTAVQRAADFAADFNVTMTFGVADVLKLSEQVEGEFDVVLSCDNAFAHFIDDAALYTAAREAASKLRENGLLLISIRDYDQIAQEMPRTTLPNVTDLPSGRRIVYQVWDWAVGARSYELSMFITQQEGDQWRTTCLRSRLRALRRADLSAALREAGLRDITWHMPEASGYYQPIVTARK